MTITDPEREEWLAWRRNGIGASDIAAILGISPWASPWSIWADKVGLLPPEPETEPMKAGRWLEAAIGPWFEHETGLHVAGQQTRCTHKDHAHHRCTVDGFVYESDPCTHGGDCQIPGHPNTLHEGQPTPFLDHALGDFEVKVQGFGKRYEELPDHHQAQGQWQMHVTGLERVWFAVLMGRRLDIHELARDDADIAYMVARADDFWMEHVIAGTPPPVDGHDATTRALAAVYPDENPGEYVELDPDMVDGWNIARALKKEAEADEKAAANEVRAALGEAEAGTVAGQRIVSLRSQTRTTTCPNCHHKRVSDPFRVLRAHQPKEN